MTDESLACTGLCPAGLRGYALGLRRAAALVGGMPTGSILAPSGLPAALRHLRDEAAIVEGFAGRLHGAAGEAEVARALETPSPRRSKRTAATPPAAETIILQPGTVEELSEEGGGTRFRAHGPRGWRMFDTRAEADAWIAGQAPPKPKRKAPVRVWTDEQRAVAAERMRAYNAKRGGKATTQEAAAPAPEVTPAPAPAEAGVLTEEDLAEARSMLAQGQGAKALSDWFGVHPLEWWQEWCERERLAAKAQP